MDTSAFPPSPREISLYLYLSTHSFPLSITIYDGTLRLSAHEIALYLYLGASSTYHAIDGAYRCNVSLDQMCVALRLPMWRTRRILKKLIKANLVISKEDLVPHLLPMIAYTYHVVVL